MTVTGMANLAVKVADLDAACDFYQRAGGDRPRPHGVERGRAGRRAPRSGDAHPVHPGDLRGRRRPPRGGIPASGALHRRPRRRARRARGGLGSRDRRGCVRTAPHRVRRRAGRDTAGVHGAARAAAPETRRHELHALRPSGTGRVRRPRPHLRPQRARRTSTTTTSRWSRSWIPDEERRAERQADWPGAATFEVGRGPGGQRSRGRRGRGPAADPVARRRGDRAAGRTAGT